MGIISTLQSRPEHETTYMYSDQESVLAICYSANYFGSLSCKMFIELLNCHFSHNLPNILLCLSHHKVLDRHHSSIGSVVNVGILLSPGFCCFSCTAFVVGF